ncbi:MAG: orotidine-5'-phosphate decarboxylase [Fimbriimonadales bacterium]|nr:orotidine-5'-phosphate decarboxylase [Fimbriimonadales bacterium]
MDASILQRVILALDTADIDEACAWVRQFRDRVHAFKVGGALIVRHGLEGLEPLRQAGATRLFLDLKFHDIPSVVALAVRQAAQLSVWMLTLHLSGGREMLRAAREAVADRTSRPLLMGVTVLTSLDALALKEVGIPRSPRAQVWRLAQLAHECGLDGVIASPQEIRSLRRRLPPPFLIVTPGVRPAGTPAADQKRLATPDDALRWGADYLVMGRALLSES